VALLCFEHYTRGMGQIAASVETTFSKIAAKVAQGVRIGRDEARWLWVNASDEELRSLAGRVRDRFHAPGSCTYMVMRIINYTNVCVAQCDYCAFYKLPSQDGGYVLSHEEVFAKLDELLALGGDLRCGLSARAGGEYCVEWILRPLSSGVSDYAGSHFTGDRWKKNHQRGECGR